MANQHSCRGARLRDVKGRWRPRLVVAIVVAVVVAAAVPVLHAERREIDTEHSTLTVNVYKSGLFSALADNHSIEAPLAGGTVNEDSPLSVTIEVQAAALRVRDPNLSGAKRSEVQTRMVGPRCWMSRASR